jgi:hypothetical protein
LLRLAIDYSIDRCIYKLRGLGLPDRSVLAQPANHAIVEARFDLAQAFTLISRAHQHAFDAIFAHHDFLD